jgi:hypothetical protein
MLFHKFLPDSLSGVFSSYFCSRVINIKESLPDTTVLPVLEAMMLLELHLYIKRGSHSHTVKVIFLKWLIAIASKTTMMRLSKSC